MLTGPLNRARPPNGAEDLRPAACRVRRAADTGADGAGGKAADDVVDAEFEEVKDDKK